ncbi:7388_t:CDS:1, partial [Cetraspora pellucida]
EESKTNESVNLHADSVISTVSSNSSVNSRHSAITNFLCQPLTVNEQSRFEQLLLRMIVSNALPFTFVKNEDTIAVFEFLVPGLKLPKRKVIGSRVLMNSSKLLQDNIIKTAKNDMDEVTTTFDGWTNIRQEHIWGIVFITINGQSLIWGVHDISSERSQTQNVINHIEQLITKTEEKNINIKAFISDSASEYAAIR